MIRQVCTKLPELEPPPIQMVQSIIDTLASELTITTTTMSSQLHETEHEMQHDTLPSSQGQHTTTLITLTTHILW